MSGRFEGRNEGACMRLLIACSDDLLVRMIGGSNSSKDRIEFLVENQNLKRKIQRHGYRL
jgi:hypothetical protein